jgi:hypothetical protein
MDFAAALPSQIRSKTNAFSLGGAKALTTVIGSCQKLAPCQPLLLATIDEGLNRPSSQMKVSCYTPVKIGLEIDLIYKED